MHKNDIRKIFIDYINVHQGETQKAYTPAVSILKPTLQNRDTNQYPTAGIYAP
jgi:hypothetical protein